MRVIAVIDLKNGRAVHARAGERGSYQPVTRVGDRTIQSGDALDVAHAYVRDLGVRELYVADLDAIAGAAPNKAAIRAIAAIGVPVWLDAGISSGTQAAEAVHLGAARSVAGLETLPSFAALGQICRQVGRDRAVFSLDLRAGQPLAPPGVLAVDDRPSVLARMAADAGVGAVILIDLATVGMSAGPDFDIVREIRAAVPQIELIVGGGVRGVDDLAALRALGCDGALVATALQDGRLRAADLHASESR